jgi:hypothetical protein
MDHLTSKAKVGSIVAPTTDEEKTCARWYDVSRESLLREYNWNFAKTRAVLMRTGTPLFDYTDSYTLPADCLKVYSIGGTSPLDFESDFDIEGRTIVINNSGSNALNLRYIRNVIDVSQFDPLFIEALGLKLALNMTYKYTQKKSIVEAMNIRLINMVQSAAQVDNQERPTQFRNVSKVLRARRRGYSYNPLIHGD